MKLLFILAFIFISTQAVWSQPFNRELNSIPFSDQSGEIKNIFSGGINNPEFFFIDIDNDEDFDIVYLDSDGTFGWYKNTSDNFTPEFEFSLDPIPGFEAKGWFYFVDIDNDGDPDLFTGGASNFISFYRNDGSIVSPFFVLEIDTLYDSDNNLMFSEFGCNPLFADVDNDGDYDFVSGNSAGTLTYYENIGTNTSFNFKFITTFWQEILIISTSAGDNLHGASSLDFADIDNDGDLDLFWGDFFSQSLYYIKNSGTAQVPDLNVELTRYPPNADSLITSGFNMPRFIDIDADGDLDLFVSVLYDPTVPQTLINYENIGSVSNPEFMKRTENFIKTLDAGNESVPVFFDIDDDGDKDLFIGCANNPNGSIYFFENVGTATEPSFLLIDTAYFDIQGELSLAPAFGDLDNDGDAELLVGNFDGTISLFRNTGSPSTPNFIFETIVQNDTGGTLDIGVYARPVLIDSDDDNDLDLTLGRFNGRFSFYRNIGNAQTYSFREDPNFFGTLDVGDNSTPHLIDYDNDSDFDLFSGNRSGMIIFYKNDGTNITPVWNMQTDSFIDENFGSETAPYFVDIDGDTDNDLFIGNIKGGLYFYNNTLITAVSDEIIPFSPKIEISSFPNPFNAETQINVIIPNGGDTKVLLINILGEEILMLNNSYLKEGRHLFSWNGKNSNGNDISSGNYFLIVTQGNNTKSHNLLLLK